MSRALGPLSPGTVADDASVGTVAWILMDYAKVEDANFAAAPIFGASVITHYLKLTAFGLVVPGNAVVRGISARVKRRQFNNPVRDYRIRIVKGGVIGATEMADLVTVWGTSPALGAYKSYGGPEELWGEQWGPGDIDSGFGIAISATSDPVIGGAHTALVNHVYLTVYYELGGVARHRAAIVDAAGAVKGQIIP
jgi:hypothetical protein